MTTERWLVLRSVLPQPVPERHPISDYIQEHVANIMRTRVEQLELDCLFALKHQRYDMLERIVIVDRTDPFIPPAVASMVY